MRVFAVRPDEDLRRRLDAHLELAARPGGPTDNELLCRLLERGLAATDARRDGVATETGREPSVPAAAAGGQESRPPTRTAPRGPHEGSDGPTDTAATAEGSGTDGVAALDPEAADRSGHGRDGADGGGHTAGPSDEEGQEPDAADDAISDRVGDVVDTLYDR